MKPRVHLHKEGIDPIWNPVLIWRRKAQNEHAFRHECKKQSHVFNDFLMMPHVCLWVCVSYCLKSMFTATLQYVPCYKTWSELNVLDQQIKGTMLDISKYLLSHFQLPHLSVLSSVGFKYTLAESLHVAPVLRTWLKPHFFKPIFCPERHNT